MPIRINFLAEEQAAEDLRRRDPVKRAVLGAVAVVGLVVAYIVVLVVWGFSSKRTLTASEGQWEAMKTSVESVEADEKMIREIDAKMASLNELATNRFLWGPVLNAFQQTVVDNVAITRLMGEQSYVVFIAPPPDRKSKEKPKPSTSTQKITLRVRGTDVGERAERSYASYLKGLASFPYFAENLVKPNGVRFSQPPTPGINPSDPEKQVITFELECVYPEVVR